MTRFEIKHRYTRATLYEGDGKTLKDVLVAAVKAAVKNGADLRGADLDGADLRGAYLRGAYLRGADLRGADLRGAYLRGADLRGAYLRGADLRGADLDGAYLGGANFPERKFLLIDDLDVKIIAAIERGGSLEMSRWHTCETTHCRAGWAVHMLGNIGAMLEAQIGSEAAGALIYAANYPELPVPNFYDSNEGAMADIRSRAALATTPATPETATA